jgi:DNA-directed RNA polymerase subunit RPC12/RpoP
MRKYVCDICKKDVGEHDLVTLHKHLQSVGIEHVCNGCRNEIEKVILGKASN